MILVTNNMVDFKKIYAHRKLHPGLIFMGCGVEEIFDDTNQVTLFNAVLDDLLQKDILQEYLYIELLSDSGDDLVWEITRDELPKHYP